MLRKIPCFAIWTQPCVFRPSRSVATTCADANQSFAPGFSRNLTSRISNSMRLRLMLIASPICRLNPQHAHVSLSEQGLRSGVRQIKSEQRLKQFAIKYGESLNSAINGGAT